MATPEHLTCIFHEQNPIVAPRRSSDDLPVHIKGIVRWYPDAEPQAGYYVPKKYSPSGDFEPLEFINNQWFGLFGHPETSTTQLCTRASTAIPIVNRLGIGYWDITDPEHPDFIPGTVETIDVDPPEEHSQPHTPSNTVTIYVTPPENTPAPQTHYSGPTPGLTITSTSTITFPTTPSPTTIPIQPQPTVTMSASATGGRSRGGGGGGGGAVAATATTPTPSNGGMRGIQPAIFNGTHALADDFWAQFRRYKMVNRTHDSMTKAYDRVLTALTYI